MTRKGSFTATISRQMPHDPGNDFTAQENYSISTQHTMRFLHQTTSLKTALYIILIIRALPYLPLQYRWLPPSQNSVILWDWEAETKWRSSQHR